MADPVALSTTELTNDPAARPSVSVLLPLPLSGTYDYWMPDDVCLAPGDFVTVPFGRREIVGVVWGPAAGDVPAEKMRPATERRAVPPMPDVTRRFIEWVADYTVSPPGAVLRMAMSAPGALDPPRPITAYTLAPQEPAEPMRMTRARERVIEHSHDPAAPDRSRAYHRRTSQTPTLIIHPVRGRAPQRDVADRYDPRRSGPKRRRRSLDVAR